MASTPPTLQQKAKQTLDRLEAISAQILASGDLDTWQTLGNELGFPTPVPEKPNLPSPPPKPDLGEPPREDDATYQVELSTMDKLLSSRRIKKQQAALNRFEKDRKAWNEDRAYALGLYEQAQKKHTQEVAALEADYEAKVAAWKQAFEAHLRQLADHQ